MAIFVAKNLFMDELDFFGFVTPSIIMKQIEDAQREQDKYHITFLTIRDQFEFYGKLKNPSKYDDPEHRKLIIKAKGEQIQDEHNLPLKLDWADDIIIRIDTTFYGFNIENRDRNVEQVFRIINCLVHLKGYTIIRPEYSDLEIHLVKKEAKKKKVKDTNI